MSRTEQILVGAAALALLAYAVSKPASLKGSPETVTSVRRATVEPPQALASLKSCRHCWEATPSSNTTQAHEQPRSFALFLLRGCVFASSGTTA